MRFAFAASRPPCPVSAAARRATQRSQRMPVTCNVSVCVATISAYRPAHEVRGNGFDSARGSDLELPERLRLERLAAEHFTCERSCRDDAIAVRVDELGVETELRCRPTVLEIVPAVLSARREIGR